MGKALVESGEEGEGLAVPCSAALVGALRALRD